MESLAMGEYGAYVWSSFGIMLIVVVIAAIQSRNRHQRTLVDLMRRIRAMEAEK